MRLLRSPLVSLPLAAIVAACSSSGELAASAGSGGRGGGKAQGSTATSGPGGGGSGGAASGTSTSSSGGGGSGGGMAAGPCSALLGSGLAASAWVTVGADGQLSYATLPRGDRIADFSYAGYMGGGVAIPSAPVMKTVAPSGGADDTPAIQAAIDAVSAMSAVNGIRGAVLLAPGTFAIQGTITITTSGVVLRGSGSGAGGTVLKLSGTPRAAVSIQGTGSWKEVGQGATITDAYVPSGGQSFHVDDASGLSVGAAVLVDRPVTQAWIHFMGMDTLVRNGKPETWIAAGSVIHADRVVTAISGTTVTIDAPITDAFDAAYTTPPGVKVVPYTFAGRIQQVGLESVRLVAPTATVPINQPIFSILSMNAVIDGWVKDVVAQEFTNGFVLGGTTKRITIEDASVSRTAPIDGSAGYPFSYDVDGQQILVQRSSAQGDDVFSYATMSRDPGPNVVYRFSASGHWTNLEPHERWATGLLLDAIDSPGGSIDLVDRGYYGTGHGWTIGFGVVWNSTAAQLTVQKPPGAENWAIGTTGMLVPMGEPGNPDTTPLPAGIVDSPGVPVTPQSLYLAQLCARLGPQAVTDIGD